MVRPYAAYLLEAFLAEHGLSQAAAAVALGVSGAAITSWIHGDKAPEALSRHAIEKWTGGKVPALAWLSLEERARLEAVVPYRRAA
jgi:predicted transcriptional regulator